jgi:hypothetical protein
MSFHTAVTWPTLTGSAGVPEQSDLTRLNSKTRWSNVGDAVLVSCTRDGGYGGGGVIISDGTTQWFEG